MAKAKKSEPAAKKSTASVKAKPQPAPGSPIVDTGMAAQSAARMLIAKKHDAGGQKKSGGLIDQLKADLNKASGSSVTGFLDKSAPAGAKKSHLPFGGKQSAHNQTVGGDITRSGVPRRNAG